MNDPVVHSRWDAEAWKSWEVTGRPLHPDEIEAI